MKRLGILAVTHELLAEALQLPDGCRVVGILAGIEDAVRGQFRVMISGPTLPEVPEGFEVPWVTVESIREPSAIVT